MKQFCPDRTVAGAAGAWGPDMLDRGNTELGRITKSGVLRSQGLWPPQVRQPGVERGRKKFPVGSQRMPAPPA